MIDWLIDWSVWRQCVQLQPDTWPTFGGCFMRKNISESYGVRAVSVRQLSFLFLLVLIYATGRSRWCDRILTSYNYWCFVIRRQSGWKNESWQSDWCDHSTRQRSAANTLICKLHADRCFCTTATPHSVNQHLITSVNEVIYLFWFVSVSVRLSTSGITHWFFSVTVVVDNFSPKIISRIVHPKNNLFYFLAYVLEISTNLNENFRQHSWGNAECTCPKLSFGYIVSLR